MKKRQKQVIEAFQRVQDFLSVYPPPNPPAKYAEQKAALDASVQRLLALTGDQYAGLRQKLDDTREQQKLRARLRADHLKPISRIAKAMLSSDPEIQKALAMPEPRLASTTLAAVAEGMRKIATKYEQLFVDNGRPADFLARLDAAIAALRQCVVARSGNVRLHVGAKHGLTEELRNGRKAVQMLDAMVEDAFAGNGEVLARWRVAKRVQESPGAPRATGGTADENVAAAKPAA